MCMIISQLECLDEKAGRDVILTLYTACLSLCDKPSPFDVVKTRQQMVGSGGQATVYHSNIVVEGAEYYCGRQACAESIHQGRSPNSTTTAAVTSSTRNVGTFGYMHQIVQNEGISALWKGNVTRMVKIAPA